MAIGDIDGDLATAYLTPAQRAAQAKGVQSITGGPIARASSQLPAPASLADATPSAPDSAPVEQAASAQSAPATLDSAFINSAQLGAPAQVQPPQSLSAPNGSQTPQQPATLASAFTQPQPTASVDPASTPAVQPAATVDQPQQAATLDSAYRATGIGAGKNAVVGRIGADGVPEFTNSPASLADAGSRQPVSVGAQQPTSLAQLSPGAGATPDPAASLQSLGSAANLGDGIGTFSQANAGDAALAAGRFQRANDLRQGYRDQDRLNNALAANTRADNTTIVRDSSKPLTRAEVYQDKQDQIAKQGRLDNITSAQNAITGRQQTIGTGLQLQKTAQIQDAFNAANAPGATAEQKQRYQSLIDPTGAGALKTQQALATLGNTQVEGQLKQQQLAQNTVTQTQAAQDRIKGQEGQIATFDQALGSVDALLGTKVDPKNPNGARLDEDPGLSKALGPIDALAPTLPGSKAADFEARLDTLKAQTFLPQVAALKGTGALSDAEGKKLSDSVGALSTKMSEDAFRKSLAEVRSTLQAAKDRSIKSAPPGAQPAKPGAQAQQQAQPQAIPTITSKAQADALPAGSVFIGPDGKQYRK